MDASAQDLRTVAALRAGDEAMFVTVVRALDGTLRRLARSVVADALVDEVVQETWVAVLRGLAGFEGRASFRTWVCRILINRGRTIGTRAARMVPVSSLGTDDDDDDDPDLDRFGATGSWTQPPALWPQEDPARLAEHKELVACVEAGLERLPERQRQVVTLRDLQGWTSEEVCNALELSESNQRVLLHRGRARLRAILETQIASTAPT